MPEYSGVDSHMWNDPAVKGSLQSDPIQERCAHMSGLWLRPTAAASMTFAIGRANQISALVKRFGNHGLCLTGMSSRGVIVD